LIVDTAGRLHIDEAMMTEIAEVVAAAKPHETLLVVDAMAGQDAVESATVFHSRLPLTGLVLAKADGDARGGAFALGARGDRCPGEAHRNRRKARRDRGNSIRIGSRQANPRDGGHPHARRACTGASRFRKTAEAQGQEFLDAQFTFEDFYSQLQQFKKMGTARDLLKMIPGLGGIAKAAARRGPRPNDR